MPPHYPFLRLDKLQITDKNLWAPFIAHSDYDLRLCSSYYHGTFTSGLLTEGNILEHSVRKNVLMFLLNFCFKFHSNVVLKLIACI